MGRCAIRVVLRRRLNAERVLDDPGGLIAVVAVNRLRENVGHGTPH